MLRSIVLVVLFLSLMACTATGEQNNEPTPAETDQATQSTATKIPPPEPTEAAATSTPEEAIATPTPVEPPDTPTAEAPAATMTPVATEAEESAQRFEPRGISVSLQPVASGFRQPVNFAVPGDGSGRLFIVEKGGRIRITQNGELLPEPFLDVSDRVSGAYEQGLLGLAFEPERPERFYINYTDRRGSTIISRWRVSESDPNVADPTSEEVLLNIEQPAPNHNGGHLLFGPDGYLWIGLGDGGASGDRFRNGQNPQTLLGSMLRIDVGSETGYEIPEGNPYTSGEEGRPEIWAVGLRNPWRYSFDRETGELWIGDVGQNAWEEIDKAPRDQPGLNYGWPILEGQHCYQSANCSSEGLRMPVTEYANSSELGCSVTGGHVYRGEAFPNLTGGYFFADFCSGLVWAIPADTDSFIEPTLVLQSGLQISAFGMDESGELYVLGFGDGVLYRLVEN